MTSSKEMDAMTTAELLASIEELTGLPAPPEDAPDSEIYKWFVAGFYLRSCRDAGNDAERGKREATVYLLAECDEKFLSGCRPYIEIAIGRELTASESAGKKAALAS